MVLSRQEEAQFIQKYDRLIWRTVHRFKRKMTTEWNNCQDLYQEGVIVLLNHIRKAPNEDALKVIPVWDMMNAMCRFCMSEQVVTIPKRTTDFTKSISRVAQPVELSTLDEDERCYVHDIDEVIEQTAIKQFIDSLDSTAKSIVELKMRGYTNREVSRQLGLTDVIVCRQLKRMREKYLLQCA